mmetsp:Transcript_30040/g.61290  ORF Transcript_30040/g.61290 Transcript_30040/m.61290 type:complete len:329 (-) Transcript_30040:62-1048(-)
MIQKAPNATLVHRATLGPVMPPEGAPPLSRPVSSASREASSTNQASTILPRQALSTSEILSMSFRSGAAGALAMGTNVASLMWLRTMLKYQYTHGGSMIGSFRSLYAEGGIRRFYRGLPFALVQAPMCRFGDTAANTGTLAFLDQNPTTAGWHVGVKTCVATALASAFRVCLMPIDTSMTTMQVQGSVRPLVQKIRTSGPSVLFHGSAAAATASVVGHFPWFLSYNFLRENLPAAHGPLGELGRQATIGFLSSLVSDTSANFFFVIKVNRQSSKRVLSYSQVIGDVVAKSGVSGLFFRGLETRIFSNGLQGLMFSVLWKYFETAQGVK